MKRADDWTPLGALTTRIAARLTARREAEISGAVDQGEMDRRAPDNCTRGEAGLQLPPEHSLTELKIVGTPAHKGRSPLRPAHSGRPSHLRLPAVAEPEA